MSQVQRWWLRYGWQVGLVCVGIYAALILRQQHSMLIPEIYAFLNRPFAVSVTREEYLEDARLRELQYRVTELENQNAQFQQILQVSPTKKSNELWAPVIGRSGDGWWQEVLLGKGKLEGIKSGDIVKGHGGLVGRITNVGEHSAQVLLVSDPSSQVGVMVSRSRIMGVLKGKNQNLGAVEFFVRDADVKAGDVIVTSPISSLFPQGIPVGKIRSVDINKQPAPEAIVEFSAPLALLEYVLITRKG